MAGTIEDRMLDLQTEKVRLARTAFRKDCQENVSEQRIHHISEVFGLCWALIGNGGMKYES